MPNISKDPLDSYWMFPSMNDPISDSPHFENKLNRLESRPLRERLGEGSFAMRIRCFEEIFVVLFNDLEGAFEDLGKAIYFSIGATFTPDLIKATEYTEIATDHTFSGLIRPWATLVDIIKLLAGIIYPPAAIRPRDASGENRVRYPRKEIEMEVEEKTPGSLQDALEDSSPPTAETIYV